VDCRDQLAFDGFDQMYLSWDTTQLSFSGSKPVEPGAVAKCSVKVLAGS
jgi:hypothetical protein